MKKILSALSLFLLSTMAHADLRFFNSSGANLGVVNKVFCSTGVTCTSDGSAATIVSSPSLVGPLTLENNEIINNTTDDTVEIMSEDEATTLKLTGFEAKAVHLLLYPDQGDDAADKFSLDVSTSDVFSIGNNGTAYFSMSSAGAITGPGSGAMSGFLNKLVQATATTITIDQCGSTFYNAGAVAINLPEASTALGCKLTFVTMNASNFDVNPDDADTIMVLTNANGDSIRNATLGNSVVLQAMSASQWAVVGKEQGTWSDIN